MTFKVNNHFGMEGVQLLEAILQHWLPFQTSSLPHIDVAFVNAMKSSGANAFIKSNWKFNKV